MFKEVRVCSVLLFLIGKNLSRSKLDNELRRYLQSDVDVMEVGTRGPHCYHDHDRMEDGKTKTPDVETSNNASKYRRLEGLGSHWTGLAARPT